MGIRFFKMGWNGMEWNGMEWKNPNLVCLQWTNLLICARMVPDTRLLFKNTPKPTQGSGVFLE
ncbi:hypothetical protein COE25_19480 [Bacillus sp. AFS031507]|nr:hypothetical protein COE25_19480 [Bacillus sp. AFS031507]